jgi:hypothetical protein
MEATQLLRGRNVGIKTSRSVAAGPGSKGAVSRVPMVPAESSARQEGYSESSSYQESCHPPGQPSQFPPPFLGHACFA